MGFEPTTTLSTLRFGPRKTGVPRTPCAPNHACYQITPYSDNPSPWNRTKMGKCRRIYSPPHIHSGLSRVSRNQLSDNNTLQTYSSLSFLLMFKCLQWGSNPTVYGLKARCHTTWLQTQDFMIFLFSLLFSFHRFSFPDRTKAFAFSPMP